jgi:hypothetical protein
MIESTFWADQFTSKWFETMAAVVAVLPEVISHPFFFGSLGVPQLVFWVWLMRVRVHVSPLSVPKIKVSAFVVNTLEHSLETASLALTIISLLRLLNLRRFLWYGYSFPRSPHLN